MASRTICIINVGGADVSSNLLPRLINLQATIKAGGVSDTASFELDDSDGAILLPRDGVSVEITLGDDQQGVAPIFIGVVDEVKSAGSRSSGRTLTISAKGVDTKGKPKEPQQKHWDNQSLSSVFSDAAQRAGLTARVDPSLGSIQRPYWAMQGESFLHWGERIAREVGGTFKVVGNIAVLAKRNGGMSPSGGSLAVVSAAYGVNLISWDLAPFLGRPRYRKTKVRWYDQKKAEWVIEEVEVADPDAQAEFTGRYSAADSGEAKNNAESRKADSERGKGGGSVTINGNNSAEPEGTCLVSGVRPGIDGIYRIDTVNHDFSRGTGWTTRLDLKQPHGEAGQDGRGD